MLYSFDVNIGICFNINPMRKALLSFLAASSIMAAQPTKEQLKQVIDHTYLKVDVSLQEQQQCVKILISDADEKGAYAVCVRESMVSYARKLLDDRGSPVKLASVIGFPKGDDYTTEEKIALLQQAIEDGADEFDMVFNYEAYKRGEILSVYGDVYKMSCACGDKILKIIFENGCLPEEAKPLAYKLVFSALITSFENDRSKMRSRFFKTSTGFAKTGATLEDVRLMYKVGQGIVGIKAAGGVKTFEDAVAFFEAAGSPRWKGEPDPHFFRIGTSSLLNQLN